MVDPRHLLRNERQSVSSSDQPRNVDWLRRKQQCGALPREIELGFVKRWNQLSCEINCASGGGSTEQMQQLPSNDLT